MQRSNTYLEQTDWEAAINSRRSTRSFEIQPVEELISNQLDQFIEHIKFPFDHGATIKRFKANPDKKLYTIFNAPPDNLAFISHTDICSISKTGFVGEMIILYATSLGLATCWYGHYNLAELERVFPHLGLYAQQPLPRWGYGAGQVEGERVICITPIGYWEEKGLRLIDRMQTTLFSHRRKAIDQLLAGNSKNLDLPPHIAFALDLARKAPSGANSQHWRFSISPDYKTITVAMPEGYKHVKWEHPNVDIGICACHFWLGLKLLKIDCNINVTEEQGRAIWRFELL
jgi:nitroreductase